MAQVAKLKEGKGQALAKATGDKGAVVLLREASGWRLQAPFWQPTGTSSPRASMRQLANALARSDWGAIVGLLTRERQEQLGDAMLTLLGSIGKYSENAFLSNDGTRASLRWTENNIHFKLDFLLEDGQWRLNDLHIQRLNERESVFE